MKLHTIISGGQTGADRGALRAAHHLGLRRGGMAPAGWRAEDGAIPEWFRAGMTQSGADSYRVRTRANVEASHGTLIVSLGPLPADSGSMLTAKLARQIGKPYIHLLVVQDRDVNWFGAVGVSRLRAWLEVSSIGILNVAGPRESREPGIEQACCDALYEALVDDEFGWTPTGPR